MSAHWVLDDISWDSLDADRISPEILSIVKAAALVESNAADYERYLCNVFQGDAEFCRLVETWAREEEQHGAALGRWAQSVDPSFDYPRALARFRAGYRLDLERQTSVRGSLSGELIARCIVETGTSSFYTALAEATQEPVLQDICRRIAGDEFRHYKLFYDHLIRYLQREDISRLKRLHVGLGRMGESEDDELAYAYYAANTPFEAAPPYDRKLYGGAYLARAYACYRRHHVDRVVAMVWKACGLKARTPWQRLAEYVVWGFVRLRLFLARPSNAWQGAE